MTNLRRGFLSIFDVRSGEGQVLTLLFITAFFKGASILFFETAANTKFLSDFGVSLLPHVYIATAIISVVVGFGYIKYEKTVPPLSLMKGVLAFLIVIMAGFYFLMLLTPAKWLSLGLMVWKGVHWVLIQIEFWAVAGYLFNVRQGKRLFGLVATGDVLSNILGGFGMPWIVAQTGTVHLLLIAGVGLGFCFVMLMVTEKTQGHRFARGEESEEVGTRRSLLQLCRDRYLSYFFILSLLSCVSFFLLDYIFYDQVKSVYTNEATLASFFGIFFAVLSLVKLVASGVVVARLLARFGVVAGLVAAQAVAFLGVFSALGLAALALVGGFLWVLIGTKLFHEAATSSVEAPTFRILYQPLRPADRLRAQAVRECIIEPTAIALAGLLILLMTEVWQFASVGMSYVLVAFVGMTVVSAFLVRREYVTALIRAISRRRLFSGLLSFEDASSRRILEETLKSDMPVEVMTGLKLIERADHPSLGQRLLRALEHPDAQVRRYALERIEANHLDAATDRVVSLMETESDSEVRGDAVRVFCALSAGEAFDAASLHLDSAKKPLRRGAIVGLLRSGGLEGVLLAGSRLNDLLKSSCPEERQFAAEIIGDIGRTTFYRPLLELLNDVNGDVRRAALVAAGRLSNPKLVASIIERLREPSLREAALKALVSFGEAALPGLAVAFDREEATDGERVQLVRLMGRIRGESSTRSLLDYLIVTNRRVQYAVLDELGGRNFHASGDAVGLIRENLRQEIHGAVWILAALLEFCTAEEMDLLANALKWEARHSRERILFLLSFLYPSQAILDAKEKLCSDHADMRANGLEVVDNLVSQDVKAMTLPLFSDIPIDQQLSRLKDHAPQEPHDREALQRELITNTVLFPWTRACAIYLAGKCRDMRFMDTVRSVTNDPSPLVRETAAWAVSALSSAAGMTKA
ncbi:MAG: HEAT repeat domain-containing protein [Acidobacteriia bacterium]|nr:HEAT repeat domain-containing protein [Terriglobia bacterium]